MPLESNEIQRALMAILFAAGEPVEAKRLAATLEVDEDEIHQELQALMDMLAYERSGIRIIRRESAYQMCSSAEMAPYVTKALETRKPPKLSASQLEALTIIAYYQPTTRAYVDQIRGVDSSYTVGLLVERKLIEECGRLQVPGRPRLYRTTKNFLRSFHLTSLEDLPSLPGMESEGQLQLGDDGTLVDAVSPAENVEENENTQL